MPTPQPSPNPPPSAKPVVSSQERLALLARRRHRMALTMGALVTLMMMVFVGYHPMVAGFMGAVVWAGTLLVLTPRRGQTPPTTAPDGDAADDDAPGAGPRSPDHDEKKDTD